MTEVEMAHAEPSTTYDWLSGIPFAATAGTAVYNMYEGSKNYNSVTQYTLGTVESSVKMAASAIAPVVKTLDKPIHAVDSYAVSKLVQLEEKMPVVKTQPEEVVTYLTDTKEALTNRITENQMAISTRIAEGKESLTSHLTCGKEAVYSKISAGSEAVVNSRAGVAVSNGKQALASHLAQGKETLGNTIASGRKAVYTKVQCGAESLANSRAGCLVGAGVNHTLASTENWVEYLLPEIENEKELFCDVQDEDMCMVGLPRDSPAQDDKVAQPDNQVTAIGRVARVRTLSRKVKLRVYFRSMQRLQSMQQNCKATLEHLNQTVDLLKLAQGTREVMDKRYQDVTSALKDVEERIKLVLSRQSSGVGMSWLSKDTDEDEVKIEWLTPRSQGLVQSSLDYAKQLNEKVFHTLKSVTAVSAYLPSHLRGGATQGYQYAQEIYSTLKPVQSPTDLTVSTLNRISSLLEVQLGYVSQLGTYLSSVLQKPPPEDTPAHDEGGEDGDDESSGSESDEATE